jgi:S-disulfanyl-L-cysteine oxidoreductase SoxD
MKQFAVLVIALLFWLVACAPSETPTTSGPLLATLPTLSEIAGTPAATVPPLPALDAAEITLGQAVYETHCAACHGANLEGQPEWKTPNEDGSWRAPPHDATGHTWHHSDKVLLETIRLGGARLPANVGVSAMPAYADVLSEEEMTAVLTYIKSTWPEDIRTIQWEATVRDQSS